MSVIWFSKIKDILEYRKFSEFLFGKTKDILKHIGVSESSKEEQHDSIDSSNESAQDPVEEFEDPSEIFATMTTIIEKADEHIDILFARYFIQMKDIINFVVAMYEKARENRLLDIRILLPSPRLRDVSITNSHDSNISIKYFDRHLNSNTVTSILDNEDLYIVGPKSDNPNQGYFLFRVNNESKKLVYTALFEKMWLLEKSVDYG